MFCMDIFDRLDLQMKRRAAYEDDEYELDDWEGFTCNECGNRQLSAEADLEPDEDDELLDSICSECGGSMETTGEDTLWDKVREKIPEGYLSGEAMETDLPECPACKEDIQESDNTVSWALNEENANIHERCAEAIWKSNIENPHWYDSFTPEHYEKAADYLRSLECVGEVITNNGTSYGFGEMYIHTNYCTTGVVQDVVDDFNGRIVSAGVTREDYDHQFDCVSEHGTCFEILIDFCGDNHTYNPPEALDRYSRDEGPMWSQDHFIVDYDNYEEFFDADFSVIPERGAEEVPEKHKD